MAIGTLTTRLTPTSRISPRATAIAQRRAAVVFSLGMATILTAGSAVALHTGAAIAPSLSLAKTLIEPGIRDTYSLTRTRTSSARLQSAEPAVTPISAEEYMIDQLSDPDLDASL